MPERFLLQILRRLVTQGVLRSTRGIEGGYALSKPPSQITLLDIVESFDDKPDPDFLELPGVSLDSRKRVIMALKLSAVAAQQELQRWTVADLLGESSQRRMAYDRRVSSDHS